jgi:hypothetical protein
MIPQTARCIAITSILQLIVGCGSVGVAKPGKSDGAHAASDSPPHNIDQREVARLEERILDYEKTTAEIFKKLLKRMADDEADVRDFVDAQGMVVTLLEADLIARVGKLEKAVQKSDILDGIAARGMFEAAQRPVVVPLKPGLPVAIVFPKPIRSGLKWSDVKVSVGRTSGVLSLTAHEILPDVGFPVWIVLEDDSLFELRLVNVSSKYPFQTPIKVDALKSEYDQYCGNGALESNRILGRLRELAERDAEPSKVMTAHEP